MKQAGLGAFYTPKFITDFIARRTLYWYFRPSLMNVKSESFAVFENLIQGKGEGLKTSTNALDQVRTLLNLLVILDPSAGSGMFLLSCAEYLEKIYHALGLQEENLRTKLTQKHIYGWDIDPNAIQILHNLFDKWRRGQDVSGFFNQSTIPTSTLKSIAELAPNFPHNFVLQDALEVDIWSDSEKKNMLIIGNPPFGNLLPMARKKQLTKKMKCRVNEISELFVEQGFRLLKKHRGGILSFILPKTITYYQKWQKCRDLILQHDLIEVHDLGIAFPGVNLEQILLINANSCDFQSSINLVQYIPLKKPDKSQMIFNGTIPRAVLETSRIIITAPLTDKQAEIIFKIKQKASFIDELGKITRSLYISDKEKSNLQTGNVLFLNKIPDLNTYSIKKLYGIRERAEFKDFLKPKLIFKVLRGSRLNCFPDEKGAILTTEKAVNLLLADKWIKHAYALTLFLNSRIPSFYIQATLYSQNTETSRVIDPFYAAHIPVPEFQADVYNIADLFCKMLIFTYTLEELELFKKILGISESIALFAFFNTDIAIHILDKMRINIFTRKTQGSLAKLRKLIDSDNFNLHLESFFQAVRLNPPIATGLRAKMIENSSLNIEWSQIEGIIDQIYKDLEINAIEESCFYQEIYQLLGK